MLFVFLVLEGLAADRVHAAPDDEPVRLGARLDQDAVHVAAPPHRRVRRHAAHQLARAARDESVVYAAKEKDVARILMVGDSFHARLHGRASDTLSRCSRRACARRAANVEGDQRRHRGYSTDQEVSWLDERASSTGPGRRAADVRERHLLERAGSLPALQTESSAATAAEHRAQSLERTVPGQERSLPEPRRATRRWATCFGGLLPPQVSDDGGAASVARRWGGARARRRQRRLDGGTRTALKAFRRSPRT